MTKNPPHEFASFIEAIESEGFQSWEIPLEEFGIVLNYRDGLDYCWLTEVPQNPKHWIARFMRVDQLRSKFLKQLAQKCGQNNIVLILSKNGDKSQFSCKNVSGELWLGSTLSDFLADSGLADPLQAPYPGTAGLNFVSTPQKNNVVNKQLEYGQSDASGKLTMAIRQKYPDASWLIGGKPKWIISTPALGSFEIRNALLKQLSPEPVRIALERIDADYQRCLVQRCHTLRHLLMHLASLGYSLHRDEDVYSFGTTHRELEFVVDELFEQGDTVASANTWLELNGFASLQSPGACSQDVSQDFLSVIPHAVLPDFAPQDLPILSSYDLTEVRRRAEACLAALQAGQIPDADIFACWANELWHQPSDPWWDESKWRALAVKFNDGLLMHRLGDTTIKAKIAECLNFDWTPGFAIYEGNNALAAFLVQRELWPKAKPLEFFDQETNVSPAQWAKFFDDVPYPIKRYARNKILQLSMPSNENENYPPDHRYLRVFKLAELPKWFSDAEISAISAQCVRELTPQTLVYLDPAFLHFALAFGCREPFAALLRHTEFWGRWQAYENSHYHAAEVAALFALAGFSAEAMRLSAWVLTSEHHTEDHALAAIAWKRCHVEKSR